MSNEDWESTDNSEREKQIKKGSSGKIAGLRSEAIAHCSLLTAHLKESPVIVLVSSPVMSLMTSKDKPLERRSGLFFQSLLRGLHAHEP
jgi:hypothetical protein